MIECPILIFVDTWSRFLRWVTRNQELKNLRGTKAVNVARWVCAELMLPWVQCWHYSESSAMIHMRVGKHFSESKAVSANGWQFSWKLMCLRGFVCRINQEPDLLCCGTAVNRVQLMVVYSLPVLFAWWSWINEGFAGHVSPSPL